MTADPFLDDDWREERKREKKRLQREERKAAKKRLEELMNEGGEVITDITLCQQIVKEILEKEEAIGLDTEGVNLGFKKNGRLTLVQVSTADGKIYIFDVLINPDLMTCDGGLRDLLQADNIIKVIHDYRMDTRQLSNEFGIIVNPLSLHDTQRAHSKSFRISYNKLCQLHKVPVNSLKDTINYRRYPAYWAKRPLTKSMINYAAADVRFILAIKDMQ